MVERRNQLVFGVQYYGYVSNRRNTNLLGDSRVRLIEDGVPGTRWNLTGKHDMGQLRLLARVSYFGEYYDNEAGGDFDSAMLFDLEAAMT